MANPANTNALILKEFAPSIPEKNITCLTRLDHNRALGQISEILNVQVCDVKNVIIWGNHSSTQYPDVTHATVNTQAGEKAVPELVCDDAWYKCFVILVLIGVRKSHHMSKNFLLLQVERGVHFNCSAAWCCNYQSKEAFKCIICCKFCL